MGQKDGQWHLINQVSGKSQYWQDWRNGVLVGGETSYDYDKDAYQCSGEFANGKKTGSWTEKYHLTEFKLTWFLLAKGEYSNGKRIGIWNEYYHDPDIDTVQETSERNVEYSQDTIVKMTALQGFYSNHDMSMVPYSAEWRSIKLGIPVTVKMVADKNRMSGVELTKGFDAGLNHVLPDGNLKKLPPH
jgi:hypothetical protein